MLAVARLAESDTAISYISYVISYSCRIHRIHLIQLAQSRVNTCVMKPMTSAVHEAYDIRVVANVDEEFIESNPVIGLMSASFQRGPKSGPLVDRGG